MLGLIIFSKNRAMQLQAIVDSIKLNAAKTFRSIDVIYIATEQSYQEGYDIFAKRNPKVNLVKQGKDLINTTLKLIKYPYICLAADDDIFYKKVTDDWEEWMHDDVACFSMRLGLNINYCYSMGKQNSIKQYEKISKFIRWEWRGQEYDWAYPMSSISHIYRTSDFIDMCLRINKDVGNLNQYEAALQEFNDELPKYMMGWESSVVFGVPANKVNETHNNNSGLEHPYTIEKLNEMYLSNQVIDIKNMIFDINAAQQEIEYKFKTYIR